jgi:adenosylhomocysteine nucleosidase
MSAKVGIVSAMDREVAPLLKDWRRGTLTSGTREFSIWAKGGHSYIQSGIGRQLALAAARALVADQRPDILISAGFAGALTPLLSVGETITVGTVIDVQTSDRFDLSFGTGTLVSAVNIADETEKKRLAAKFKAQAVDMEASAVAQVARESGIPFCAVKAISDELGFVMPPFNAYVDQDGKLELNRFAAHMAIHPGYWPSLMQLARNSKIAAAELSSALERLLESIAGETIWHRQSTT